MRQTGTVLTRPCPDNLQNTHKHFGNNRPQAVVKATEVILNTDIRTAQPH